MTFLNLAITATALILVLVMAWLVIKALSLYSNKGLKRGQMQLLEVRSLAGREKLALMRFRGHDYLLGVTPSSITLIDKSPQADELSNDSQ